MKDEPESRSPCKNKHLSESVLPLNRRTELCHWIAEKIKLKPRSFVLNQNKAETLCVKSPATAPAPGPRSFLMRTPR